MAMTQAERLRALRRLIDAAGVWNKEYNGACGVKGGEGYRNSISAAEARLELCRAYEAFGGEPILFGDDPVAEEPNGRKVVQFQFVPEKANNHMAVYVLLEDGTLRFKRITGPEAGIWVRETLPGGED